MQQTRTDPPYIPMRARGWPTRRSPRWLFAAGAVLLIIAVAVGLAHHPTKGQRASDLRGLLQTLNQDVGSCAAGVQEALVLLRDIDTGASHNLTVALSEVNYGAANCSPANNEELDDLTAVQVPESLASYHLANAVTALINWAAPDAIRVQTDVATALSDHGKPTQAAALAALRSALRKLNAQRAVVYAELRPAIKALAPHAAPPVLYG